MGKAEHRDERVVEVRASGELDVFDARRKLERDLPLAVGEQRDLRPLTRRVAHRDDPVHIDRRDQPDDLRALGIQVGTERPAQQHLVQVLGLDSEDIHQNFDSSGDRTLRELQLADVLLRQINTLREQEGTHPVHVDEPLA